MKIRIFNSTVLAVIVLMAAACSSGTTTTEETSNDEEVVEEEPRMELPPIRPKVKVESKKKNEYDDLFDN